MFNFSRPCHCFQVEQLFLRSAEKHCFNSKVLFWLRVWWLISSKYDSQKSFFVLFKSFFKIHGVRYRSMAMCKGEFSAVIARLISKCSWCGWKWYRGVRIGLFLPSCSVIRECPLVEKPDRKKRYLWERLLPLRLFWKFS